MANETGRRVVIKRGDAWDGETLTLTKAAHDFTGTTVKVEIRNKPDGTIYLTLNPSPSFPALGEMTIPISLTGAQTATFPLQKILADVQVYRASPLYGPYTIYSYVFDIQPDITQ